MRAGVVNEITKRAAAFTLRRAKRSTFYTLMRLPSPIRRLCGGLCLLLSLVVTARSEITGLILTWRQDPTTTQVIDWHQAGTEAATPRPFAYRAAPERRADGANPTPWLNATPEPARDFPFSDRKIYRVELTGLRPDTRYEFRLGEDAPKTFRTLPATLTRPLRFMTGGDLMHEGDMFAQMNRTAAALDPAFIIWGGDLAYENGAADQVKRMQLFVEIMQQTLIAPDGRVIPVIVTAGNHEVIGGYYTKTAAAQAGQWPATAAARAEIAPYYCALWAFPGHPGYGALDLGDYASLLLLDTDHTAPIEGAQTDWLAQALRERAHRPHLIPIYHVPGHPSARPFDGSVSKKVRTHWLPLYDAAGVRLAFENHDHTYKRTKPWRAGKEDPAGVVYVGDGAWGVRVRDLEKEQPYLERFEKKNHGILLTMHPDRIELESISATGEVFDRFTVPARK